MDFAKVNVEVRNSTGKGPARRARAAGQVPAVLYGRNEAPVTLTVDPLAIVRSMDKQRKRNTVFQLAGAGNDVVAMIRDVQIDPLTQRPVHIDFLRVSLDEEVRVTVPLVLTGTAVGVTDGGNLHQSVHAIAVAAKPAAIPVKIELDVSALKIGDALHVSDVKLAAGVRVLLDAKEALASVVAPRADKAEEAAAAAPVEGAAAAPAAGAAAGGDAAKAGGKEAAAPAAKEGEKKGK